MTDREFPDTAPLWASIMYDSQRDGFKAVHGRIDHLEATVKPLTEDYIRRDERKTMSKKLLAAVATAGTILGTLVSSVLGSSK